MYEFKVEDAIRFASEKGFKTRRTYNELVFQKCPYCGNASKDKEKFAINLGTGQFNCFRASCGAKGNMLTLAKDFDFSLGKDADVYYGIGPRKHYKVFKKQDKPIESKDDAVKFLESRGISEDVCRKYQITTDSKGSIVFPFIDSENQIQFIKYRNPAPKEGQSKEWAEKDCKPILFGMYQCNADNRTLIVTEGQIDSLSVSEAGFENAVSVPNGSQGFSWVPYCWDWMKQFTKIIIFGDHEKGHITLYDGFSEHWGSKVWHVRAEDYLDCKDANDILRKYGADQIKKCIENAVRVPVKKALQLCDVQDLNPYNLEKMETGIKELDNLLCGGLPFRQIVLITGKAGDGKSTLAGQLLLNAIDNDYKVCAYSGELPNYLFKSWLNYQAAGSKNIEDEFSPWTASQTVPKVKPNAMEKINAWYKDRIWIYDNSICSEDTDSLVSFFEEMIIQYGVRVLLVDNLMTALDLAEIDSQDKYDGQSKFMKQFTRLALQYNVLVLMVAHKRKDNGSTSTNDNVSGSADITNLASIVLSYERGKEKDGYTEDMRCLKVTKNRLFGKIKTDGIKTQYDERSKRIYTLEAERDRSYIWDLPFMQDVEEPEVEIQQELDLPI